MRNAAESSKTLITTGVDGFVDPWPRSLTTSLVILEDFGLISPPGSPRMFTYGLETMSEHLRMIFYRFGCVCGALAPIGGLIKVEIDENPLFYQLIHYKDLLRDFFILVDYGDLGDFLRLSGLICGPQGFVRCSSTY